MSNTSASQPATLWSRTFSYNMGEGHTQPAPEFGAPAMTWHIAFWPKTDADPNHTATAFSELGSAGWRKLFGEFKEKRKKLYASAKDGGDFNSFLVKLQRKGRLLRGAQPEQLLLEDRSARIPEHLRFDRLETTYLCFTLWWLDEGETQTGFVTGDPAPSAIRVRVSVKAFFDHTTVSFYLDAGKPWNLPSVYTSKEAVGKRRAKIFKAVEDVRAICQDRLAQGAANKPLLPEHLTNPSDAQILHDASEYLYSTIWGEFCRDFGFYMEDAVTPDGRCFANFRGLVMSTDGVVQGELPRLGESPRQQHGGSTEISGVPHAGESTPGEDDSISGAAGEETDGEWLTPEESAWPGVNIHKFADEPADGKSEANAVIKAFWPFVRRITHDADYKEHIACGLLNWRALFITSLGAKSTVRQGADWKHTPPRGDVPAGGLLDEVAERDPTVRDDNNQLKKQLAVRYLFLTKFEPHRRQIGRIVERMNRLGTIRLFALKGLEFIQNADIHIRILGQELDGITHWWSTRCDAIQREYLATGRQIQAELEQKHTWFKEYREKRDNVIKRLLADLEDDERDEIQRDYDSNIENLLLAKANLKPDFRKRLDILKAEMQDELAAVTEHSARQRVWAHFKEDEWKEITAYLKSSSQEKRELLVKIQRDNKLAEVTEQAEKRLIHIMATLDELGHASAGGLHYRIGRSSYYIEQFNSLVNTLAIGDIPTWIPYNSFADRGLRPIFDMIQRTGQRLQALRTRLTAVTESIQTSALVVQSSATRENTDVLKKLEGYVKWTLRLGLPATLLGLWWDKFGSVWEMITKIRLVFGWP